jgi:hypothetical protein
VFAGAEEDGRDHEVHRHRHRSCRRRCQTSAETFASRGPIHAGRPRRRGAGCRGPERGRRRSRPGISRSCSLAICSSVDLSTMCRIRQACPRRSRLSAVNLRRIRIDVAKRRGARRHGSMTSSVASGSPAAGPCQTLPPNVVT